MTTGEGIFWAVCLVLFTLGIWRISKAKKWRTTGLVIGAFLGVSIIIGGGIYFYYLYQNRPVKQFELYGVKLGMTPVEVRLTLGEPLEEMKDKNADGEDSVWYLYKSQSWEDVDRFVRFKNTDGTLKVYAICDLSPSGELYDIYSFTTEDELIEKFGNPTSESINDEGLRKFLNFRPLNLALQVTKKQVSSLCVMNSDARFIKEYTKQ